MSVEYLEYEATVSLETRNRVDLHRFYWQDDNLFSTLTNRPVEESMVINNEIDYQDVIGFRNIKDYVRENSEGVVFWLSPPHELRTTDPFSPPQAKITIYEVQTIAGRKETFNRSVLFDTTKAGAILIANKLAEVFSEQELLFDSEEAVRTMPVFTSQYISEQEWTYKIEQIISNHQWQEIASGEDIVEYQRTLDILQNGGSAPVGQYGASCPPGRSPSAITTMFSEVSKFVFKCGNCNMPILKFISAGYQCKNPECLGVYLGC